MADKSVWEIAEHNEEMFKRVDKECPNQEFKFIPAEDRLCEDDVLCGLMYLHKIRPNKIGRSIEGAGHDVIWVDTTEVELTFEDALYLDRCGFFWDSDNQLSHYV